MGVRVAFGRYVQRRVLEHRDIRGQLANELARQLALLRHARREPARVILDVLKPHKYERLSARNGTVVERYLDVRLDLDTKLL